VRYLALSVRGARGEFGLLVIWSDELTTASSSRFALDKKTKNEKEELEKNGIAVKSCTGSFAESE